MNPESIDRIEHSTYTPLEKKYLKVQFVKVTLVYLGLMAVSLFLLCAEGFAYRYALGRISKLTTDATSKPHSTMIVAAYR